MSRKKHRPKRAGRNRIKHIVERRACGKPVPSTVSDYGTPELKQHATLKPRETEVDGITGVTNASECLLDVLRDEGGLGEPGEALVRHGAGIWLRETHEQAFGANGASAYEPRIRGDGQFMPDPTALGLTKLMREAGDRWPILRQVAIENTRPMHLQKLNDSLDWLESYRHLTNRENRIRFRNAG